MITVENVTNKEQDKVAAEPGSLSPTPKKKKSWKPLVIGGIVITGIGIIGYFVFGKKAKSNEAVSD